jgi:hypothetical protein
MKDVLLLAPYYQQQHFIVRLMHPLGVDRQAQMRLNLLAQLWSIALNPAINCLVLLLNAPFCHYFL